MDGVLISTRLVHELPHLPPLPSTPSASCPMPATVRTPRSSDGTSIHAEAVGDPRNPHVVFIHEATLSSSVFDELFEDPRLTEHLYLVSHGHVVPHA